MPQREAVDMKWADYGVCVGLGDIFYSFDDVEIARAKRICSTCPVIVQCRTHARANKEVGGVWGGESEKQRARGRSEAAKVARHGIETGSGARVTVRR
jgi:WhiB family redox-sensing transcriptional regulator